MPIVGESSMSSPYALPRIRSRIPGLSQWQGQRQRQGQLQQVCRQVWRERTPCWHSDFTHSPKDRNCESCCRTKMTRVSCRRRNSEAAPRAEKFGKVNHETIIDTRSWCKISPHNEFNLIRKEQKLLRRWNRVHASSSSRHRSQKLFTLTTHWSLADRVKNSRGITERPLLIDPRQMAFLRQQYE